MNDTVFQRHRHPKQESWQHWYRPFGNAACHKTGQHCSSQIWQRRTQWGVRWENPHVIHDDVALWRRQTWQRCILSGIQRMHTPSIYMHTYVLVSSHAPWHRLLGRGLSCEKARGNVPVLRVHIIALRWYFLGNKVLCFFFSVTACHVFVRFAIPVKLCLQQDHLIRLTH